MSEQHDRATGAEASKVCLVVRAVGERTAEACQRLLERESGGGVRAAVVGGKPFPQTLAEGLRAGLASGRRWTLCVDADVLPFIGAVAALVAEAERHAESVIEVQPVVLDRFFGGWRPAGVHLYRTALLDHALAVLSRGVSDIRPETAMLRALEKEGFRWIQTPLLFGTHDFEQWRRDIHRKCFVQAWKHVEHLPRLLPYWRARTAEADFRVALRGLGSGIGHLGTVELDERAEYFSFPEDCEKAEAPLGEMDPRAPLEQACAEEDRIHLLGAGVAPVWDWIDATWAMQPSRKAWMQGVVRVMLQHGMTSFVLDGACAAARVLLTEARAWGIKAVGVIADRKRGWTSFRGLPLTTREETARTGRPRVIVPDDETIEVFGSDDRRIGAVLAHSFVDRLMPRVEPHDILAARTVDRLVSSGVRSVFVYGAGEIGRCVLQECTRRGCVVTGFIETTPDPKLIADLPVLSPQSAVTRHDFRHVLIASLGSARTMVKALLDRDFADTTPPCVWLLQ